MDENKKQLFVESLRWAIQECHEMAKSKGFWDHPFNFAEKIALIHSELSEALESDRDANSGLSEKFPQFQERDVELADVLIRLFDLCGYLKIDLPAIVIAKMDYNSKRPYKHGKSY
jgi:NTP pyrophosphatase (non-canonical NTP hydrolase)